MPPSVKTQQLRNDIQESFEKLIDPRVPENDKRKTKRTILSLSSDLAVAIERYAVQDPGNNPQFAVPSSNYDPLGSANAALDESIQSMNEAFDAHRDAENPHPGYLSRIVSATDKLLGRISSGSGPVEEITFTDFAQTLIDDASAAEARSTLGLVINTNVPSYALNRVAGAEDSNGGAIGSSFGALSWERTFNSDFGSWTTSARFTTSASGSFCLDATVGAAVAATNTLYVQWVKDPAGTATVLGVCPFFESEDSGRNVQARALVPRAVLSASDVIEVQIKGDNATNTLTPSACTISWLTT